ncbi:MAG: hypothetical protein ACO388_09425 [Saprospiraceae bacterium]|jgi:hypothetical protein
MKIIPSFSFKLIFSFLLFTQLSAAKNANLLGDGEPVKIFLDCGVCDFNYIKQNFPVLSYVRDVREASVYVMVRRQNTGAGGKIYTFFFEGQEEYIGRMDTLEVTTAPDATQQEIRNTVSKTLIAGMMPYIAKTDMLEMLEFKVNDEIEEQITQPVDDQWNAWVFEIGVSGNFNGDDNYQSSRFSGSADAQRIVQKYKFLLGLDYDYNRTLYKLEDGDYLNIQRSYRFSHLLAWSLNDHWSIGEAVEGRSSIYSNLDFSLRMAPAVEYNFYPYAESAQRQFAVLYSLGPRYFDYTNTTVFGEDEELRVSHQLRVSFAYNSKWGSVRSNLSASQYLHDTSLLGLYMSNSAYLRILKGLNLRMGGGFSLIRNQLSLVQGEASLEEVLLRQRELARNFNYFADFGVSYTFGSFFNNIVNPRFPRGVF